MCGRVVYLVLLSLCVGTIKSEAPIIETKLGQIQGTIKTSFNGRNFLAFEGVPFAKPPIGKYRFSEPKPVEPWRGVWKANHLFTCPQINLLGQEIGDDDCLYLNIYVPEDAFNQRNKLDVLLHIHGGGFIFGSNHEYIDPIYTMDRDLVMVSINYRVGVFGFLSTEDEVLPGNLGIKDQILALKWVNENIDSFGGNPNSVTLIGMSAGAASVHLHYLTPESRKYFQRGISQSGVALNMWVLQKTPLKKAQNLARIVGCPQAPSKNLFECIRHRPTSVLLKAAGEVTNNPEIFGVGWNPVIDSYSKNPVLSDHPFKLLKNGKAYDAPWISSNTADDGIFPAILLLNNLDYINKNWDKVAAPLLDYEFTLPPKNHLKVAQKIKQEYFEGQPIGQSNLRRLTDLFTHRFFTNEAIKAVKLQAKINKSPVYYYLFSYEPNGSFTQRLTPEKLPGVAHLDDALFIFKEMVPSFKPNQEELKIKDNFLDLFESFTKTGIPKFSNVEWKASGSEKVNYLDIAGPNDIKMAVEENLVPSAFWDGLGLKENEKLDVGKDEL